MTENVTYKEYAKGREQLKEEIKECRHGWKNSVSDQNFKLDDHNTDIALLKQNDNTMAEKVQEIKQEMKEGFDKIEKQMIDFLKIIKDEYATKADIKETNSKVSFMYGIFGTGGALIGAWLVGKFLELI